MTSGRCPIGPLNLHTMNYEQTECIWCGPNVLAAKEGRWIKLGDGLRAWSVTDVPETIGVPADV
jgi:hypothetical protein